jgi:hypothetical protein
MANKLYVHLGLHKTGTSTIQNFLNGFNDELKEKGMLVPTSGWVNGAHHQFCYDVLNPKSELSIFETLRNEISAEDPTSVILSSEEFERFSAADVHTFVREVGIENVKAILYLRRQDGYIVSDYGQQVKMGASLPSLDQYLDRPTAAQRFNYLFVVGNWWATGLGERGKTILYETVAKEGLLQSFIDALDAEEFFSTEQLKQAPQMNVSWSWEETNLARRTTLAIRKKEAVSPAVLHKAYRSFYPEMQALCEPLGRNPLALTQEQFERVRDQYKSSNELLLQVIDLSEEDQRNLMFETSPKHIIETQPQIIPDETVLKFAQRVRKKIHANEIS